MSRVRFRWRDCGWDVVDDRVSAHRLAIDHHNGTGHTVEQVHAMLR